MCFVAKSCFLYHKYVLFAYKCSFWHQNRLPSSLPSSLPSTLQSSLPSSLRSTPNPLCKFINKYIYIYIYISSGWHLFRHRAWPLRWLLWRLLGPYTNHTTFHWWSRGNSRVFFLTFPGWGIPGSTCELRLQSERVSKDQKSSGTCQLFSSLRKRSPSSSPEVQKVTNFMHHHLEHSLQHW